MLLFRKICIQVFYVCLVFILQQLQTSSLYAQETSPLKQRLLNAKRVGIVLSGGGAKGLAHVGALKALHEFGIDVQVVGGTSMGAIVGGMYALGYNPVQLDSIFSFLDYDDLFFHSSDRKFKSIFNKYVENNSLLKISVKDFKIRIPVAYSTSLASVKLYNKMLVEKNKSDNFKELDKEFYCVATNINKSQPELFDSGSLITAVMASSAFPFIFFPPKNNNYYYTDGGIFNNFPVNYMMSRKVDFIIGVDVEDYESPSEDYQEKPVLREDAVNISSIMQTILSNLDNQHIEEKREMCDIYIHPDIQGITTFNFKNPEKIIQLGYEKTKHILIDLGFEPQIKIPTYKELVKMHNRGQLRRNKMNLVLEQVDVSNIPDSFIRKNVSSHFPKFTLDKSYKFEFLNDIIKRIYNTHHYQDISYTLMRSIKSPNAYVLKMNIIPDKSDFDIRVSASYSSHYTTEFMVGMMTDRFLTRNSMLSFQILSGASPRYNIHYYLDRGAIPSLGLSAQFYYYSFINDFDKELIPSAPNLRMVVGQYNFMHKLFIRSHIKQFFAIETGVEYNIITQTLSNTFSFTDNRASIRSVGQLNAYGTVFADALDNDIFPMSGFKTKLAVKISDLQKSVSDYAYSLKIEAMAAITVVKNLSLNMKLTTGNIFSYGNSISSINAFKFGGPYEYNIYNTNIFIGLPNITDIFTEGYIYGNAGFNWNVVKKMYLQFNFNALSYYPRQGYAVKLFESQYVVTGVGLSLGYNSSIAPFMLGLQFNNRHDLSLFLRLGYIY